jgi:hypothetical protein
MTQAVSQREESTELLTAVCEELLFAWRIILCTFYISWWRIKHYIWHDPKLNRGALIVGAISATILLLDILLFLFGKEAPTWLGRSAIFVLVPTALLLTLHRIGEARKVNKERSFASHVEPLVDALTELSRVAPQDRDKALTDFVTKLLGQIHDDLARVKRVPVTVSVMPRYRDGKLRIAYLYPEVMILTSPLTRARGVRAIATRRTWSSTFLRSSTCTESRLALRVIMKARLRTV